MSSRGTGKAYNPFEMGGEKEKKLVELFRIQRDEAEDYFMTYKKPRLDKAFKLYMSYTGDRAKKIDSWQSNIFIPYIFSTIETLMPRILDARPELDVMARKISEIDRAAKVSQLLNWNWEIAKGDKELEEAVRASLIYGESYFQVYWLKDERELEYLSTKDINAKKYKYIKKKKIYYDAPVMEGVDPYELIYDPFTKRWDRKQYFLKRLVLSGADIKKKYPMASKVRLELAFKNEENDLTDWASIRREIRKNNSDLSNKNVSNNIEGGDAVYEQSNSSNVDNNSDYKLFEVFEWWRPRDDKFGVFVAGVPIFNKVCIPNPFDFKDNPFIPLQYLKPPFDNECIGLPYLLENPQLMLNTIKNQRLDASLLNIHKMWIVNPLANINKKDLTPRPFGIIWSQDPQGVREVQFSDVKSSAFEEENALKADMRYTSGVDDASMGVGGSGGSATEIRHLRESTLERVRLFINHIGETLSVVEKYWYMLYRQFMTNKMEIRVAGKDGNTGYALISKDDLDGTYDFRSTVIPSIAGQIDIERKQMMDLVQLIREDPSLDQSKVNSLLLSKWKIQLDQLKKTEETQQPGMDGAEGLSPEEAAMMESEYNLGQDPGVNEQGIPNELIQALAGAEGSGEAPSGFSGMNIPIDLLQAGAPPTAPGISGGQGGGGDNKAGFNRTGRVNTNIPLGNNSNPTASILKETNNLQS